jgi:hypothetical protein
MGFYGTKIAFSASKPNAVERRMEKLGDSILHTTIAFKIELLGCFPAENWKKPCSLISVNLCFVWQSRQFSHLVWQFEPSILP